LRTVEDYIDTLTELRQEEAPALNKTRIIRSFLSPDIYPYVDEAADYESIVTLLKEIYVKRKNIVYARHLLVSRRQAPSEKVSEYLQALKLLAEDCSFETDTAAVYRDELIRDSFINGLVSPSIRQRLMESENINFQCASELAESLEQAHIQASSMGQTSSSSSHVASVVSQEAKMFIPKVKEVHEELDENENSTAVSYKNRNRARDTTKPKRTCYYSGGSIS